MSPIRQLAPYVEDASQVEQLIANGDMVIVFCFSSLSDNPKAACLHCVNFAPAVLRYCKNPQRGIQACVVLGASSVYDQEIEGYPTTLLFKFGALHSEVVGGNEQALQQNTTLLIKAKPGVDQNRQGYVYYVHDDSERYVGQTKQRGQGSRTGAQVRLAQEAGPRGHNAALRELLNRDDVKREAAKICRMVPGAQQRDCLDHFELQLMSMTKAHGSNPGGLNRKRGNAGLSQKMGYDYGQCTTMTVDDIFAELMRQ